MTSTRWLGGICAAFCAVSAIGTYAAARDDTLPIGWIDDFSGETLNPLWVQHYKPDQFTQENGVLVGRQINPNHGATLRVFVEGMADASFSFDAKFSGETRFNAVMGDPAMRHISHVGHIARLNVNNDGTMWLSDDLYGLMKIEHRDLPKAERDEAIKDHMKVIKTAPLNDGKWHTYLFEIRGETARIYVDGNKVGELTSPGFAHPGKTRVGFSVNGGEAHFDNMRLVAPE